jgi:hypothetical protein
MTFGNPALGQTQKYGRIKPVNGITTLPLLIIGSPMAIHIQCINK